MLEAIFYKNLRNGRWDFNTNITPLHEFTIDGASKITDRPKMQQAGNFRSYNYLGEQLVHLSGDLIADTSEEYIQSRLNFMSIMAPPDEFIQKFRYWGTLYLKYYGQEQFENQVTLDGYPDVPMTSQNPTVTSYAITFKVFNPYWQGSASGKTYLI